MDLLHNLLLGLAVAASPANLLFAFIGCILGTLVGVLPGIGPLATLSMLIPVTFHLDPTASLIMLAGIFYGAQYGGSTTAILVNLPGEASSITTCIEGHRLAQRGRAGAALAVAALASLFAGAVATVLIALLAPVLSRVGLAFGPAENFSLMVLGLVGAVAVARGSVLNAVIMVLVGLVLALVGTDIYSGTTRFTFGQLGLQDGIGFVPVAVGLFGMAEMIAVLAAPKSRGSVLTAPIARLWPTREEARRAWPATLRGTAIGALLGALPGGGATFGSFGAYLVEKQVSRHRAEFGHGAIEGVAAPEAGNNAAAQTSFIPMLTLGIPSNPVMAVMIAALMIQGISPGPQVMAERPELFWGLIASMLIGNVMLVIINLPLIGIWVRLIAVPYRLLYPAILLFCAIGVYSVNNSAFDVLLAAGFGLVGYVLIRLDCEPAPLLIAFVLGLLMEDNLRRALLISGGEWTTFAERPICLGLLIAAAILLAALLVPALRRTRDTALAGDDR